MKRIIAVVVVASAVALGLAAVSCGKKSDVPTASAKAGKYQCPMHPQVVKDKPGNCPICGMQLELVEGIGGAHAHGTGSVVNGRVVVVVSPERQQQIGLRTEVVKRQKLARTIRASATVEYDETRWTQVFPRVGGYVQELYVDYTGKPVEKGQPLLKLYSPDLLAAQKEYLNALKAGDASLIRAARRRLELWQISDDQVTELEHRGEASDTLELRSPASGYVIKKNVFKGKAFMAMTSESAGDVLYEIADLSHVWVHAFVYEYELPFVKVGQPAHIKLPYFPDKVFDAKVTFIYPHLDPVSRTVEVRVEADNPNLELRPDMWGNVEIEADIGEGLVVPASAVIDTGERSIAFVDLGGGQLEPRELKIAVRTDDYYQVAHGVKEDERVVTHALFLVDSESQLKAAATDMSMPGMDRGGMKMDESHQGKDVGGQHQHAH